MNPTFEQAKRYGFIFPGARMWATPENRARIAQDAALITTPNTTVPAELLAYIDPMVIEILTAPRRAREIFGEEKKGDWTTPYMKWRVDEMTGKTEPYSDYANGTTSGVNSEWQTRVQYVFQTSITYGDFEVDMSSTAKVNLAASKQRAAANVIDIDQNRFYLLGVAGKEIYGILNDPNLPAAITAGATGTAAPRNGPTRPRCRSTMTSSPCSRSFPSSPAALLTRTRPSSSASPPNWPFASARLPISTCPCWIC